MKISISVVVKHVPHVTIIRDICLPGGVGASMLQGTEKITGLWFTRGDHLQADTTFKLGFAQLICKASLIFKLNLKLAFSIRVFCSTYCINVF